MPVAFKNSKIQFRAQYLHSTMKQILDEMVDYCESNMDHVVTITDTVTTPDEDKALNRKSSTHREGRAFDISLKHWETKSITNFCEYFTAIYGHLGAVSGSDGKTKLIVVHDAGTGNHIHVQLNKAFKVNIDYNQMETDFLEHKSNA